MSRVRAGWIATPGRTGARLARKGLDLPLRVPVKVTNRLGVRALRPLNETVHVQALYWRIRHLPQSTVWKTRHRLDDIRLTAWHIKHVEIPYWKKTHLK